MLAERDSKDSVLSMGSVSTGVKEQLKKQVDRITSNPMYDFFELYAETQNKLDKCEETIREQKGIIHMLMQENGLEEDKFMKQRRQLIKSENRNVVMIKKQFEFDAQLAKALIEVSEKSDEIQALREQNTTLSELSRKYQSEIRILEKEIREYDEEKKNNMSSSRACRRCLSFGQGSSSIQSDALLFNGLMLNSDESQETPLGNTRSRTESKGLMNSFLSQSNDLPLSSSQALQLKMKSLSISFPDEPSLKRKTTSAKDFQSESPDTCELAVITGNGDAKILNPISLSLSENLRQNSPKSLIESIKYHRYSKVLAVGGSDQVVSIYSNIDSAGYKSAGNLLGHNDSIRALYFDDIERNSSKPTRLYSGSADQTLRFWDIETSRQIFLARTGSKINAIDGIEMKPEILTGHHDGSIRVYRDEKMMSKMHLTSSITHISISADGNYAIACGTNGDEISYVDLRKMAVQRTFMNSTYANQSIYNKPTFAAASDKYVIAGNFDGDIYIWSVHNPSNLPGIIKGEAKNQIHSCIFNNDSQMLRVADSQGYIYQWKADFSSSS